MNEITSVSTTTGVTESIAVGFTQSVTERESDWRSARINATNSSAPSGSCSVSFFRSSTLTGGKRTKPLGSLARLVTGSVLLVSCGISPISLTRDCQVTRALGTLSSRSRVLYCGFDDRDRLFRRFPVHSKLRLPRRIRGFHSDDLIDPDVRSARRHHA